jgi:myo-inositol-1(or 4)-monophosphatase
MTDFLNPAIDISREAGTLIRELSTKPLEIKYKRRSDLVTIADKKSEALIVGHLRKKFPEHNIVAEEGGNHSSSSEYCWYIDPLDGTTNYAHGYPVYSVSVGLAFRNEVIAGVVFDPTRDEMFSAERGSGAFLNGQRLHVSATETLSESLVATGFPPFASNHDLNVEFYFRFTELSHGVRRAGSAAIDLCSVAAGRYDGFWELKLNPWDKAAGTLMVTEAGGRIGDVRGGGFNLLGDDVFASNGVVHDEMVKEFQEILARHKS